MRLLLFDIDGTLIQVNGAGRATVAFALEKVFGTVGPIDNFSFAGKTDLAIIFGLLTIAGLDREQIHSRLPEVYDLMAEKGRELFGRSGLRPCPGVNQLLKRLDEEDTILLGLQTGNTTATASLKLAAAGIDPHLFKISAYGSEVMDRNQLPLLAWQQATKQTGRHFDGSNTIIIGDTPADISCAKANGAFSIAVATGTFSREQLARNEPDHLLNDLTDCEKTLELIARSR